MAKKTFLQHVQEFITTDISIADTAPTTTVSQTGEFADCVRYINNAYVAVQNAWQDWKFMWAQHTVATVIGTSSYAAPADLGRWDEKTIKYDGVLLDVYEYESVKEDYEFQTSNGTPQVAIIMPDNSLTIDPPPDAVANITADYYLAAARMSADVDEPVIPEQYEDIIRWRAMIYWGTFEEAPLVIQDGTSRYLELLKHLENNQLPRDFVSTNRMSADLVVTPE
jgi:hypothetical protein